jgi:hypothetical protein
MSELSEIKYLSKIVTGNKVPYYGWYSNGNDYFLNLGKMKKAIVIQSIIGKTYYTIAIRSYFPFPQELHDKKFNSYTDAIEVASKYIADWLEESIKKLEL